MVGATQVWCTNKDDLSLSNSTDEASPFEVGFHTIKDKGINFIAPPQQMLVAVEANKYVPSKYAVAAKAAGMKIITWTFERSGPLINGDAFYYGTSAGFTNNDGAMFELLHVLHNDVGIEGIFSDWPETTTFYANCMIRKQNMNGCNNNLRPSFAAKLGPRPKYLVDDMVDSPLKEALHACLADPMVLYKPHDFSIGHRGSCLQFP